MKWSLKVERNLLLILNPWHVVAGRTYLLCVSNTQTQTHTHTCMCMCLLREASGDCVVHGHARYWGCFQLFYCVTGKTRVSKDPRLPASHTHTNQQHSWTYYMGSFASLNLHWLHASGPHPCSISLGVEEKGHNACPKAMPPCLSFRNLRELLKQLYKNNIVWKGMTNCVLKAREFFSWSETYKKF